MVGFFIIIEIEEGLTISDNKKDFRPQYDGPYEVSAVEFQNDGDVFRGVLYFPPGTYSKPYPIILYFHGFPQLFALQEIITRYMFLLDAGYAVLAVNFRGYRHSEGKVSLSSQLTDGLKLIEFAEKMAEKHIFDAENINILAHDLGAYIALVMCSKVLRINKILLLTPLLDLKQHLYHKDFIKTLNYINKFLPGNVRGIDNPEQFIEMTKEELSKRQFQLEHALKDLKVNHLKIILGDQDKLTDVSDADILNIVPTQKVDITFCVIKGMEHEPFSDEEVRRVRKEIQNFF